MNAAPKTPAPRHKRSSGPEFVRTAKALLLRRRTREAINLLRRGLNLDPGCNEAALLLSKCLIAAKRLREARLTLDKLIDREESAEAYVLLVRVCSAQGDHAAAIEAAKLGLARFPDEKQLRDLQAESRLELADLLEDTTERDGDATPVEPEDLPTTRMPEGDSPFEKLLAEAGADGGTAEGAVNADPDGGAGDQATELPPDTIQVAGTALVQPPAHEDLSTSPNYRRADDGALEDPLIVEARSSRSDRTPTPLPSDDLDFDRAPGAPDVISAVKRLVEPDSPPERPGGDSLFRGLLLGDGPPAPASKRTRLRVLPPLEEALAPPDDPNDVGGPTPADSPGARRQRQLRITRPGRSTPSMGSPRNADDPTLDLRTPSPRRAPRRIASEPGVPVSYGEVVNLEEPAPEVTMPSPRAPRVRIAPELESLQPEPEQVHELRVLRQPAAPTEPVDPIEDGSLLSRWWPLWLTLGLLVIASSTVAGLVVRQKAGVTRNMTRARSLAARHQPKPLKLALHHVREAANLGGRSPEMLALAASIHAELAYDFGESTPEGAAALVAEAERLEAEKVPAASTDLALARAYLQLSQEPLPEAIGHLLKSMERHPRSTRLKLLYGEALILNNELSLARKVLEELPADDLEVLQARALLYYKSGHLGLATRLLNLASTFGLRKELAELELARMEILGGKGTAGAVARLEQLLRGADNDQEVLPRRQRAWAHLLLAVLHQERRQHLKAARSLDRALRAPPVADAEFSYRAGRLLLAVHRLDAAQKQARQACRVAPREPRYSTLQAAVELAMDRPEAAIRRLTTSDADLDVEARLVLARALVRAGGLDRARGLLDRLPASPERHLAAARLHLAAREPYRALRELAGLDSQIVETQVIRGLVALSVKDTARAVQWMRTALKKDPLQTEALQALGVIARRRGDAQRAADYLGKAVKANPYHRQTRLELGRLQLRLGSYAAAQRQFDELLLLEPSSLPALIGRARASVEQGSKEAGLYIRALRVRGHTTLALVLDARLLMVQSKPAQAAARLRELLDRELENRTQVLLWLAETEHRLGDLSHAATLYRRVIATRSGPAPAARVGLSEIHLAQEALAPALRQGLSAAEEVVSGIYPLALRTRIGVQLARCYRAGDALGAAIAELQDVLELDRANLEANLELGLIYGSLNKRDRAAQHLARVLDLDRANAPARRELTRVCQKLSPQPADCRK